MSLSISSSETSAWRRWLLVFLSGPLLGVSLILAVMIAVDPYDTGRFGLLGIEGIDDRNTRTAAASRARDAQFDSAVIGNSTAQLLNPAELSRATGLRFVQLYMTGGSPREELAVLDFFLRNHQRVGALVIVTDPSWCAHVRAEPAPGSFAYWLYGKSSLEYAVRLISWQAADHAFQRVTIGLGLRKRNDPDGFFSYEDIWLPGTFRDANRPRDPAPAATAADRDVFPEVAMLDDAIKKLPTSIPVVVVVPPTFYTTVAQPGTVAAAEREACNAALGRIVAGRPHSNFINYRVDNALTRDAANFADFIHYRPIIAEKMVEGIAASIRLGAAAKIEF